MMVLLVGVKLLAGVMKILVLLCSKQMMVDILLQDIPIVLVMGSKNILLAKLESNGSVSWSKVIGGSQEDCSYSVEQTSDNGYLIIGYTTSFGAGNHEVFFAKLNSHGELNSDSSLILDVSPTVQTITPTVQSITPTVNSVSPTVTDITSSLTIQDIPQSALTTICEGGLKNQTALIGEQFSYQFSDELFFDPDGDLLTYNATLSDGSILPAWLSFNTTSRTFEGTPISGVQGEIEIRVIADDGYGGQANTGFTLAILNQAPVLNPTFIKAMNGGVNADSRSVQQTNDAGYIITGYTAVIGAGDSDVFLVKLNRYGSFNWGKVIGGSSADEGYSVSQTIDGGYVVSGYTASYGAGSSDILLAKFSSDGDLIWG